jgi:hypothetical protein
MFPGLGEITKFETILKNLSKENKSFTREFCKNNIWNVIVTWGSQHYRTGRRPVGSTAENFRSDFQPNDDSAYRHPGQ